MKFGLFIKRLALYGILAVLGFVLGAFALYTYWVRSGPSLEIWHTEVLDAEYDSEKADTIGTFEGYRRVEEKLFSELNDKIYARTDSGPDFKFARYSAGSVADPRKWTPNWNRSFELPAKNSAGGVLLLHGMSDSPYSLRALGEKLNQENYWVIGLRLPGHGTIPSGLKNVRWEEMAAAVRLCMDYLGKRVGNDHVHIIGYSTGAPLAIDYALNALEGARSLAPASMVLISPAIGVTPVAVLAKWINWLSILPGLEKFAWKSILPEFDPYKYNSFATNAGYQVHRLTRSVAGRVQARSASAPIKDFPPTLVFLSTVDATVSVDAVVDNLLEHLAPGRHELVLFDINRLNVARTVLVTDPGPLTARLIDNPALPFSLTLITNENTKSTNLVKRHKGPLSTETTIEPLNTAWPAGMISLSHIALPFPPDDPLYGRRPPEKTDTIFLGQMAIHGERGLLLFSPDWLLRLRHNPFYDLLEQRTMAWLDRANTQ